MSYLEAKYHRLKRRKRRNIILNTVCLFIALSGLVWTVNYFWRYIRYEITNDAFIDQYVSPVNVRVAGYIQEVCFREHQFVHRGDTLVVLDSREYVIRQKEAKAALLDARGSQGVLHSNIETSEMHIAEQDATLDEAKARLWQAEQDYIRYERLWQDESVPRQQYDRAKTDYDAAKARYEALLRQKDVAHSQLTEASRRKVNVEAGILRAEAALDLANLNLSYTVVTAPYDGYMGRRTLEPGQFVSAGQTLSYIIRQADKWVTANYRETQISNIYIGQPVRIKVDGVPGKVFHGHVTAISEATGSKYSLVPTDNSAGNFVKVQQRIPVRIDFDDADGSDMAQLRAGMMVETEALRDR